MFVSVLGNDIVRTRFENDRTILNGFMTVVIAFSSKNLERGKIKKWPTNNINISVNLF